MKNLIADSKSAQNFTSYVFLQKIQSKRFSLFFPSAKIASEKIKTRDHFERLKSVKNEPSTKKFCKIRILLAFFVR